MCAYEHLNTFIEGSLYEVAEPCSGDMPNECYLCLTAEVFYVGRGEWFGEVTNLVNRNFHNPL